MTEVNCRKSEIPGNGLTPVINYRCFLSTTGVQITGNQSFNISSTDPNILIIKMLNRYRREKK